MLRSNTKSVLLLSCRCRFEFLSQPKAAHGRHLGYRTAFIHGIFLHMWMQCLKAPTFILSKENFLFVVVGREPRWYHRCSRAVLLFPEYPACAVSFLFLSFLQAGPGSSGALGLPPAQFPISMHPPAFALLLWSQRSAGYGSTFHLMQLQALATSTPVADFKTFFNNYCFSCRHFSIFVFQWSSPSLVLIVMMSWQKDPPGFIRLRFIQCFCLE